MSTVTNETEWIMIPEETSISEPSIIEQTYFIDHYFNSYVEIF
ncbi:hypothetical protein [Enterococcus haemoperoxidus]|nr:hypothetical protein [Enterococcus haemoperoxidus]OJG54353.1 hypothetical protein RV06_GL003021 [Enterococcus haemoperoxidus]